MSIAQSLRFEYQGGGESVVFSDAQSASSEQNISEAIALDADGFEIAFTLDKDANQLLMITCDQEITIYTNIDNPGTQSFSVGPTSGAVVWSARCGCLHPVTTSITSIFVDNVAGVAATLRIKSLSDATP